MIYSHIAENEYNILSRLHTRLSEMEEKRKTRFIAHILIIILFGIISKIVEEYFHLLKHENPHKKIT